MRISCLILVGIIMSNPAVSQQVTNVKADLQGDVVNIHYDLQGNSSSENYRVDLYSSHNNYSQPLQKTSGDVGENINPGPGKMITWRPADELQEFEGDITFEVRATLMAGYYRVTSPVSSDKIKKGKTMNIRWEGEENSGNVKIELIRLNRTIATVNDGIPNSGRYNWSVPKSIKAGKGFQVRVTSTANSSQTGISPSFSISGGIPVFVWIGAPIVAGGIIAAVILSGNKPPDKNQQQENGNNLPDPPAAP